MTVGEFMAVLFFVWLIVLGGAWAYLRWWWFHRD